MFVGLDHFLHGLDKYKRVIILIVMSHLLPLIIALYFWRMEFLINLNEKFLAGTFFMFLGLALYIASVIDLRKYFVLGKEFIILCPDFYPSSLLATIYLMLASEFIVALAYIFLNVFVTLLLLGLFLVSILIDWVLYNITKREMNALRNVRVLDNFSSKDICDTIRILAPIQIAVSWGSSENLMDQIRRFRKYSKDLYEICKIDKELKSIFEELDSLMDPEFVNKNPYDLRRRVPPPQEVKNRIIRIYWLEVRLLEILLRIINRSAPIKIKLPSRGDFVIGLEEIEYLNELGKMLEAVLKDEVPYVKFHKLWLRTIKKLAL